MTARLPRPGPSALAEAVRSPGAGRALATLLFATALFAGAGFAGPAAAQGLGLGADSDEPIEINADEGIEWRQEEQVYVARGNASAARGGVTVRADTLTAHYRTTEEGGTDIWRIDADGRVSIASASGTAYGDKGAYDVAKGILVLKGRALKLVTRTYTVTARDSLEYWEPQRMAVARGEAVVVSEDKRLEADVVTAYFREGAAADEGAAEADAAESELERIEAFGNVYIATPTEVARSERAVYDVQTGVATLFGSVKITRGEDQLNGEYGEVNLNTGVSKLLAGPPGEAGSRRVRALFSPRKKPQIAPREEGAKAGPAP